MSKKSSKQTANDQRSNAFNPKSPAYKHRVDDRSRQLNPEHPTYKSSRKDS
ncbi:MULTISPECIES: hypothetical protein [Neptuniibacter]|jgi:hypothetical protein|uniref:hypothetical protein n=1 Tax=Neptuniibacter TaxID=459520 RepID=UPI0026E126FD|nr:hypothetical protein [Neptuniibacter sp. 2_MG-2023]MDO6514475.1 hypothetical protein [Neptuniibacter sp. 2_MG-2023]